MSRLWFWFHCNMFMLIASHHAIHDEPRLVAGLYAFRESCGPTISAPVPPTKETRRIVMKECHRPKHTFCFLKVRTFVDKTVITLGLIMNMSERHWSVHSMPNLHKMYFITTTITRGQHIVPTRWQQWLGEERTWITNRMKLNDDPQTGRPHDRKNERPFSWQVTTGVQP